MLKEKDLRVPLNLQFFASDDDINDDDVNDDDDDVKDDNSKDGKDDAGSKSKSSSKKDYDNKDSKMFTQKQVQSMMAKEKREGKKSAYTALGLADENEAKKAADFYKAYMQSQKSDEDIAKEKQSALENDKSAAEKRAEEAEAKLSCLMAGVNKESVEDVMAIASKKVTDDKSLDDVLEEMRKQSRYASFFDESSDDKDDKNKDDGTGHNSGHSKKKDGEQKGSYGKKLAANSAKSKEKKSSYF